MCVSGYVFKTSLRNVWRDEYVMLVRCRSHYARPLYIYCELRDGVGMTFVVNVYNDVKNVNVYNDVTLMT